MEDNLDSFYRDHYSKFIETGIVGHIASLTHVSLELGQKKIKNGVEYKILEVGAGGGQHVKFCRQNYSEYIMTDLRPENLPTSNAKFISIPSSISAESLPFADASFDRVIATCLLAHLVEPEKALNEWLRVLKTNGCVTVYVPCEPGFLLRILQFLITNKKKKKQGVTNPKLMHYRDHIQTYMRLKVEIAEISKKFTLRRYPFPLLSWNLNLWAVFNIQK